VTEIGQEITDLLDPESAAALRTSATLNGMTLKYAGWTGHGNTPAVLISAYAGRLGKSDRKLVLKISPKGRGNNLEPLSHRDALARSPSDFRAAHLVEQPWDTIALPGGGWIMFQEIASGRLDDIRPLSTILDDPTRLEEAARACTTVVLSVLTDWTPDILRKEPFPTAREYLSGLLGNRLDQDGTVRRWAERAGVLSADRPVGGPTNPFTLVLADSAASTRRLYLRIGNTHGDLHPGNILIPEDPVEYRLIDLSRFDATRALTFDPTYLLLTVTAQFLPSLSPVERESVADLLVDPQAGPRDAVPHGPRAVLMAIIETAREWGDGRGFGEEWRRESLLTLIGCALVMTGRDIIPDPDRDWFYHLATLATARYLDLPSPMTVPLLGRPGRAHAMRTSEQEPDNANPVATLVLPAGTPLWRVHPRSTPVDEFVAAPAGRHSVLYVSRREVTALLDELLRGVAFSDDGDRVLATERLAGMRLSALRTTRELVMVCADSEPDLVGLWPPDGVHGVEWPSTRDMPESSLLLLADRCPPGTVRQATDQAMDLDDADCLGWLRKSLRPYRVRVESVSRGQGCSTFS
jgi:hypothetical protein